MPTKKPRFNITFDPAEIALLMQLAKKQKKSVAGLAKELIMEAMDRHEDMTLSSIADSRVKEAEEKSQKLVSHEDAWK